jgi:small subunit ribosomal protein S16
MAVRLRLSRIGKHKVPFYRIVAIDSRKSRDGMALDILGTYDALKSSIVNIDLAGIDSWVAKGAQMADSVKKIYRLAVKKGAPVKNAPATAKAE